MPTPEEKYEAFVKGTEDKYAAFVNGTEEKFNDTQSKTNQDYESFRQEAHKDAEGARKTIEETEREAQNAEYANAMERPWKESTVYEGITPPEDEFDASPENVAAAEREAQNAEYAAQMSNPDNWKESTVHEGIKPQEEMLDLSPENVAAAERKAHTEKTELIGNKTVVYNENTITSVDQNGNGYGATVNNKGMLDYFVVKDGEKEPITAQNRGSIRENRTVELSKLNDIMIALSPESELSKAAIKTGKPYSLEVIQKDVRIITTPYNEGTVKEEAKASVERMKKAKESNTQGMSLRDRIATNRSNSGM
jgi:hypothetical protein